MSGIQEALKWAKTFLHEDVGAQIFTELHDPGNPSRAWCGAFVRDILLHAGIKTPQGWDWVDNIRSWALQHHVLVAGVAGAQPGDILIHGLGGAAHTGMALGAAHGNTVLSIAGNAASAGGTVAQQNMTGYWQWHVQMSHAASSGLIHHGGIVGGGGITAAAVHRGGMAAQVHAGALAHAVALLAAGYIALEAAVWLTEQNSENVAYLERVADNPDLARTDPYLASQLQLWRARGGYGGFRQI